MIDFQLKHDDGIYIIAILITAIQFVFIWMRFMLKKQGRTYSPINTSFKVYSDFKLLIHRDKQLKAKYIRTLSILIVIVLILILFILSD